MPTEEMELQTPNNEAVETVETPIEQQPKTSFKDRQASWTDREREHWKLTGEEPKNSDAKAASSTAQPDASDDESGTAQTEPDSGPGKKEQGQKGQRENFRTLREQLAAEKARTELLERELANSRKSQPATEKETPKAETKPVSKKPVRPRLEDPKWKTVKEFDDAMDQYETDKEAWDQQQIDALLTQAKADLERGRTEEKATETWQQQVTAAKKEHPDFEAVAFSDKVPASDAMLAVIRRLPNGARISYAIGKDLAEASRIAELTHIPDFEKLAKENPTRAAYLWGQAEIRAEIELSKLVKPKSAIPLKKDPPRPSGEVAVNGKGSQGEVLDDDQLLKLGRISTKEWKRRRNNEEIAAFQAGNR